jgi:M3 family oligoendopeptidase
MSFHHYPHRPARLTAEFARTEYTSLIDRVADADAAATADEWMALVLDWNALSSYCRSEGSRVHFRLCRDFSNEEATSAEQYYREQVMPVAEEHEERLMEAMLASPHRAALEQRFGGYYLQRAELMRRTMAPVNAELRVREGELQTRYGRLIATAEVSVDGETMTVGQADSLLTAPDRDLRRKAYVATSQWLLDNRDELAGIFDELVEIRRRMAANLGYESFTRLGYEQMERTDYGPNETARFRQLVFAHFLPLLRQWVSEQAERAGTERLSIIDARFDPGRSLPRGIAAPVETQLERAAAVFSSLSSRLGEHFARMRDGGMIDHANRPGKAGGAFCSPVHDEPRCSVLLNSVGDASDVEVLLHELGHAFQKWESDDIELVDLRQPTLDLAEIHSMTMEFLGMRHLDRMLPEEHLARYRSNAWKRAVSSIVAIARIDEFQHWIYECPTATPQEREAKWIELHDAYGSGLDHTGFEHFRSASWYEVGHLFQSPFYMIDYALARLVSMQIALIDAEDHERAMATYIELCRLGGTMSFARAVAKVGLRSPFDEDLLADLAAHVRSQIDEPIAEAG